MSDDLLGEINKRMSSAFLNLDLGVDESEPREPMPEFQRNVIAMRISAEMLPGWTPDQLSPVARAKYDEEMRMFHIERNRQTFIREAAWSFLRQVKEPATRAVLDLHAMVDQAYGDPVCAHCMQDTEMGDHEDWPCDTVRAIANAHGIEMPR